MDWAEEKYDVSAARPTSVEKFSHENRRKVLKILLFSSFLLATRNS